MAAVVCFIGRSKVGKTTLLERLLPELTGRGYRVVAVKHTSHPHELDVPGKDSWRLRQAGASVSIACTPELVVETRKTAEPVSLEELAAHYWDYDLLLAEGFAQSPFRKVEVVRSDVSTELRAPLSERIAIVSDVPVGEPGLRFSFDEIAPLADYIEDTQIKTARREMEISLVVDGKATPLNPFAQALFANILRAMVTPLKGVENPDRVSLSVRSARLP